MKIYKNTKVRQKAKMFGDGDGGRFVQVHELYLGDNSLGVSKIVSGTRNKDDMCVTYCVGNQEYGNDHAAALEAAGHEYIDENNPNEQDH